MREQAECYSMQLQADDAAAAGNGCCQRIQLQQGGSNSSRDGRAAAGQQRGHVEGLSPESRQSILPLSPLKTKTNSSHRVRIIRPSSPTRTPTPNPQPTPLPHTCPGTVSGMSKCNSLTPPTQTFPTKRKKAQPPPLPPTQSDSLSTLPTPTPNPQPSTLNPPVQGLSVACPDATPAAPHHPTLKPQP